MKNNKHLSSHPTRLFLEGEMFQTKAVEEINPYVTNVIYIYIYIYIYGAPILDVSRSYTTTHHSR